MRNFTGLIALLLLLIASSAADESFTNVLYPVDPHVFAETIDPRYAGADPFGGGTDPFGGGDPAGGAAPPEPGSVLEFFNKLMEVPKGSKMIYLPRISKISVTTSPLAHEQFKAILGGVDQPPAMVSIDYTLISFPTNVLQKSEEYRSTGSMSNEEVMRLFKAGHAKLITLCKVVTLSGVNAQVESVDEIIYPTEFEIEETQRQTPPLADGPVTPPGLVPGAFETRETGHILNVTPTIARGNRIINLAIIPEKVELLGWINYDGKDDWKGDGKGDGRGITPTRKSTQSQPVFRSQNLTTSVVVIDGQPNVVGGAPHPETGDLVYGIITARIIFAKEKESK